MSEDSKPSGQREWVVGFLFDETAERVVLIRKNRPEWQAGKLNGVGGKVEPGETIYAAMAREFLEEAGVLIRDWEHFLSLTWEEGVVHFLRASVRERVLHGCRTMTDEHILVVELNHPTQGLRMSNVTPNLRWLIPLAAHRSDTYDVISVTETGTTLRKVGRDGEVTA